MKAPVAGLAIVIALPIALAFALVFRGLGRRSMGPRSMGPRSIGPRSLAPQIDGAARWRQLGQGQLWPTNFWCGSQLSARSRVVGDLGPAATGNPAAAGCVPEPTLFVPVGSLTSHPGTVQQRLQLLERQFQGLAPASPGRLAAVQAARLWGDRACLPLLIRALRDPDPAVVLEASRAIQRFRGRTTAAVPEPSAIPLPANAHWATRRIQPLASRLDPRTVARTL